MTNEEVKSKLESDPEMKKIADKLITAMPHAKDTSSKLTTEDLAFVSFCGGVAYAVEELSKIHEALLGDFATLRVEFESMIMNPLKGGDDDKQNTVQ